MSFKPFLALSASAGSGKTYALVLRYVGLLFLGEPPASILAATFTKKAAMQMRRRVFHLVHTLSEQKEFLYALSQETGIDEAHLMRLQPEVEQRLYRSVINIVTLDSFFGTVLRSASLHLGIEPNFKIDQAFKHVYEKSFLDTLENANAIERFVALSIEAQKRYQGSVALLEELYSNRALLLFSPEESSVQIDEAKKRIDLLRKQIYQLLQRSDASASALRQFQPCDVQTFVKKDLFKKESLHEHNYYKKPLAKQPQIEHLYQELRVAIAQWFHARESFILKRIFELYELYEQGRLELIRHTGTMGFEDVLFLTYRLLHEHIDREFLYFKLDATFRHILIDEFQDTSTVQFLILKPLLDEIVSGIGQHERKSFFYVGDTKQSIYRFRGGVEALFDAVAKHYGLVVQPMRFNYRSASKIVSFVNRCFEGKINGYVPQKAVSSFEGYVEVCESKADQIVQTAIQKLQMLLSKGVHIGDIAFLVHTNKEAKSLQEALIKKGYKAILQTSSSIRFLPKIAALVSMLRYLLYRESIDAEPFCTFVGKEDPKHVRWFHLLISPSEALHRLVEEFGYFHNDANVLKLLEFAQRYETIKDFLEAFDRSSIAIANESIEGATIMTIHGSKGLEFDFVIVLDRQGKQRVVGDPLLYEYDEALMIRRIYYRQSKKEHFIAQYAARIQEEKKLQEDDAMHLAYVALTRAIRGLVVVVKSGDKKGFAALDMEPFYEGSIVPLERQIQEQVKQPVAIRQHYFGPQELTLVHKEIVDSAALRFGEALHYFLEMVHLDQPETLQEAFIAVRNRYGSQLEEEQYEDLKRRCAMLLKDRMFLQMIAGAKLFQERSLVFKGEVYRLDLLIVHKHRSVVVDFKSALSHQNDHIKQVRTYMQAIQSITKKEVEGVVIYLLKDKITYKFLS